MKFVQNIERTIQDFTSFSIKVENNFIANLPIARRLRETEMWAGYLHEGEPKLRFYATWGPRAFSIRRG